VAQPRLSEHHPTLAAHLGQAVRTGAYCSYVPDPLSGIVWQVRTPTGARDGR
jgi:hypothetical protein